MKKNLLIAFALALLVPWASRAQETVVIGTPTSTTTQYTLPVNMYFNYSLTQQIITAEEIGTAGTITSISFEYTNTASFSMANVQLYMKNTSKTEFANTTDLEPVTSNDLVWTGTFSATAAGWVTINLDAPFSYDGASNLLVCFYDPTSGYPGSAFKFRTTATTNYLGMTYYSDTYTPSLTDLANFSGTKTRYQYRANMQLEITSAAITCSAVRDLSVIDSLNTYSSLTLSWTDPNNTSATYDVYAVSATDTTLLQSAITDTFYTVTDLNPNTIYRFGVMANCGTDGYSTMRYADGRTACSFLDSLPYVQDFENENTTTSSSNQFIPCWGHLNNGTTYPGYPYLASSATYNHTPNGGKGLNWNNSTTTGTYGDYQCIVFPGVDADVFQVSNLMVRFWAKGSATTTNAELQVGVMTNPSDINSFVRVATINVAGSEWTRYQALLSSYTGEGQYVAIKANRASWTVYADDFELMEIPACFEVTNLTAQATIGSVVLNWTPSLTDPESSALVEYKADTSDTWLEAGTATGFSYILSGLDERTAYTARVAALCTNGEQGEWIEVGFSTGTYGCAQLDPTTTDTVTVGNGTSTTYYLPVGNLYKYSYTQQLVAASEMHGSTTLTGIDFEYNYATAMTKKTDVTIYLANVSATSLTSAFVAYNANDFKQVYHGDLNCSQGYNHFEFDTPFDYDSTKNLLIAILDNSGQYDGSSYNFKYQSATGKARYVQNDNSPYNITSISGGSSSASRVNMKLYSGACLAYATCAAPAVAATEVTSSSVTVAIAAGANESSWEMYKRAAGETTLTLDGTATTNTYTFSDLLPGTEYEFQVWNICEGDTFATTLTLYTQCASVNEIVEDFNSYNTGGTADFNHCWYKHSTSTTNYPYVYTVDGEKVMYFYSYWSSSAAGNYSWLATPQFSGEMNTLSLEFDMRRGSTTANYGATVLIGTMTDPTDINTFDTIAEVSAEVAGEWEAKFVSLADYEGQGTYIALLAPQMTMEGQTAVYNTFYIDNLHIGAITCPRFTQCYVRNVEDTQAEVVWDANTVYGNVTVTWSTVNNFVTATNSMVVTEGNSYVITGLAPDSVYYCWVSAECGDATNLPRMITFQTESSCGRVEDLAISNLRNNSVTLTWNPNEIGTPATNYSVKVFTADSVYVNTTTTNTYYYVENLSPEYNYTVNVFSLCGDADSSAVASLTFTTPDSNCAVIGNGTSNTSSLPVYCYYKYSYTNMVWTADELASMGDTIHGVTFSSTYTDATPRNRTVTVYMGQTDYDDPGGFVPFEDLTEVFSGTMSIASGTSHIDFDTFFVRDPSKNLVLAFDDNTNSGGTYTYFHYATTSPVYMCYYTYSNDTNVVPATSVAAYRSYARPNIVFDASCVECVAPTVLRGESTPNSIELVWNGSATSYSVEYRGETDTVWTVAAAAATGTSYTVTGLEPASHYYFRVGNSCTGAAPRYGHIDGYTGCVIFAVPYSENFNDIPGGDYVINPCWIKGNSLGTTATPYTINITGNGPMVLMPKGSYIVLPEFDHALNTLQLRLTYSAAANYIYALVGVCEDPNDILSAVIIDTLRAEENAVGIMRTVKFDNYTGENGRIVIWSRMNQAYFDNLNVELIPMCGTATDLTASNVTVSSADISWTAATNASRYLVDYYKAGDTLVTTIDTNVTSITLNGLDHSTTYKVDVRTVCATLNDTSIATNPVTFTTECAPVTLPYVENFENCNAPALTQTGILPNCWNYDLLATGTYAGASYLPMLYGDNSYAHSGHYSLRLYGKAVVTLPEMPVDVDTLMISFHDYCSSYSSYKLEIGVCDSNWGDFAASFVPIDTVVATSAHTDYSTYLLSRYTGTGRFLAFRNYYSTYQYSTHYIDDIVVDYLPSCLPVINVHSDSTTTNGVWLAWNEYRPGTAWEIAYSDSALTDPSTGTIVSATSNPFLVSNLSDTTTYYFYVRTDCGNGDYSIWSNVVAARPNTWNMRPGMTDTVYMCGGAIYDDGGVDGDYTNSQSASIVVIMPSTPASLVSVSGRSRTEGSYDYLRIYDGAGTTGEILWQDNTSGVSTWQTFENIVSSSGPLTLYFHSDVSNVYEGFECNVSCIVDNCPVSDIAVDTLQPMTSSSVTLTWTGSSTAYQIEYGPAGFVHDSGIVVTSTTNSYTFTDLSASTMYDFYVRGLCNVSDTGLWHGISYKTPMCDNFNVATIGSETSTTTAYTMPVNNLWKYTLSEIIVDSAELGGPRDIEFISFYYNYTTPMTDKTNVDIYIQPTTKSSFDGTAPTSATATSTATTDVVFIDSVNAVLVYSGPLNCTEQGWNYFGFSTPYQYNGQGNLMVIVDDNSYDYNGSSYIFKTVADTTFKALACYSDSQNPDATDSSTFAAYTGSKYRYKYRPVMQLGGCGSACFAPESLIVTDTAEDAATITWTGSADSYEVACVLGTWFEPATPVTVSGNTHTFTGMLPDTVYTIGVRSVCSEESVSQWVFTTVRTLEHICMVPTNIQISNVTLNSAVIDWTPGEEETEWELNITGTNYDRTVAVTSENKPYTVTGLANNQTYFVKVRAICAENRYSDWSDTTNFTTATCQPVSNLGKSNITAHSATISWNAPSADVVNFEIEYGLRGFNQGSGTLVTVNGAVSYNLTGLLAETAYDVYVRSICAEGANSTWSAISVTTLAEQEGIEDVAGASISLYPNPASSTVTLTGIAGMATVTVVDMNGRVSGEWTVNDGTLTIDVTSMAQGAYFVRITGEQVNAIRKLIVK